MSANIAVAIAYLLAEAVNTGLKLSEVLSQADATGALPPEQIQAIKVQLRQDFGEAREFWAS